MWYAIGLTCGTLLGWHVARYWVDTWKFKKIKKV